MRLILDDGRTIGPLPLRYNGRCGHGYHQWLALAAARLAPEVRSVTVDTVPPRTELSIAFMPDAILADVLDPEPSSRPRP